MSASRGCLLVAGVVVLLVLAPVGASADYTETWSNDDNLEGWQGAATAGILTLTHDNADDNLSWSVLQSSDYGQVAIWADDTASGGNFAGNLSWAIEGDISFDFYLDAANSDFRALELVLYGGSGNVWRHGLADPVTDAWNHYECGLDYGVGWTQYGTASFAEVLADTHSMAIFFDHTYQTGTGASGHIDNFTLTPEPGTSGLLAVGLAGLAALRRRKQA